MSKFYKQKNDITFSMDEPQDIRKGEDLPIDPLKKFLTSQGFDTKDLTIKQFPSGYSNLTYFLSTNNNEYVLRRPPFGADSLKGGHDMSREYKVLSKLKAEFKVKCIKTGENTLTARRIFLIKNEIQSDRFLMTYGDGVSNINISKLIKKKKKKKRIATVTAVNPIPRFGSLRLKNDLVTGFSEKVVDENNLIQIIQENIKLMMDY